MRLEVTFSSSRCIILQRHLTPASPVRMSVASMGHVLIRFVTVKQGIWATTVEQFQSANTIATREESVTTWSASATPGTPVRIAKSSYTARKTEPVQHKEPARIMESASVLKAISVMTARS
jgi:hypothetical protein